MANHNITEDTQCKHFSIIACVQRTDRKSREYVVCARLADTLIGRIKWYGPWRQYCLLLAANTVWSAGCLADIQKFLDRLNEKKPKKG